MALTRSMLRGMGLTDEQVGAIIEEHTTVTTALKDQIAEYKEQANQYKEQASELTKVQAELDNLKKDIEDNDWKGKYDKEHGDFERYKNDVESKEHTAKIKDAYKKLLAECKVGEKHIDSIIRVTDFTDMKLTDDGKLDNVDDLKEKISSDWSGFISTAGTKGADVDNPPGDVNNPDGGKSGRAAQLAAKYRENLYGKVKEA